MRAVPREYLRGLSFDQRAPVRVAPLFPPPRAFGGTREQLVRCVSPAAMSSPGCIPRYSTSAIDATAPAGAPSGAGAVASGSRSPIELSEAVLRSGPLSVAGLGTFPGVCALGGVRPQPAAAGSLSRGAFLRALRECAPRKALALTRELSGVGALSGLCVGSSVGSFRARVSGLLSGLSVPSGSVYRTGRGPRRSTSSSPADTSAERHRSTVRTVTRRMSASASVDASQLPVPAERLSSAM